MFGEVLEMVATHGRSQKCCISDSGSAWRLSAEDTAAVFKSPYCAECQDGDLRCLLGRSEPEKDDQAQADSRYHQSSEQAADSCDFGPRGPGFEIWSSMQDPPHDGKSG